MMSGSISGDRHCTCADFRLLSCIGEGSETRVYKAIDQFCGKYVLKVPQKGQDADMWFSHQMTAIHNCKEFLSGYHGMISVPKCVCIEKYRLVEEFAPGVPLTNHYYCSLSRSEKDRISSEFAVFLVNAHQNTKTAGVVRANIENYCISLDDGINLLLKKRAIADSDALLFLKVAKLYRERDISDERACLIHCDLSENNLLYDKKSQRLSVIDFANSCVGCIYEDFIAKYNSLHCPYSFFHDVVNAYNSISRSRRINQEKIALLYYLSAINEVAAIGVRQHLSEHDLKDLSKSFLLPRLKSIGKTFIGE